MPKLKSLRGAIGSYGRVAAGGIVEVSDEEAKKLLKTKRFVTASPVDIAAAQKRLEGELAVKTVGATPGFSAMPAKPETTDRLSQMVERGEIDPDKAREFVGLQISLSTEEVQGFIKAEADKIWAEVAAAQAELDAREQALVDREEELGKRAANLQAREEEVSKREGDLQAGEATLQGREAAVAEREASAVKAASEADAEQPKAKTAKADK